MTVPAPHEPAVGAVDATSNTTGGWPESVTSAAMAVHASPMTTRPCGPCTSTDAGAVGTVIAWARTEP